MVQDTSGSLSPFNKECLFISIYESCKHRKTNIEDAAALTQTVLNIVLEANKEPIITKAAIVLTTMDVLSRFDRTAAVFYGAYHDTNTK